MMINSMTTSEAFLLGCLTGAAGLIVLVGLVAYWVLRRAD